MKKLLLITLITGLGACSKKQDSNIVTTPSNPTPIAKDSTGSVGFWIDTTGFKSGNVTEKTDVFIGSDSIGTTQGDLFVSFPGCTYPGVIKFKGVAGTYTYTLRQSKHRQNTKTGTIQIGIDSCSDVHITWP